MPQHQRWRLNKCKAVLRAAIMQQAHVDALFRLSSFEAAPVSSCYCVNNFIVRCREH